MINEALEVFKKIYNKEGEELVVSKHIPKDGTYILVNIESEKIINKLNIAYDKKNKKIDGELNQYYSYIRAFDYYSNLVDMNKPMDSKKTIHSNQIYSFFMEHSMLDSMLWTSVIFISAFIPLNIWIIMNYFRELPEDLWEAAAIEGANERQLFFQIGLPLAKPIVLNSSLVIFLMSWKQYIIPMLLLSSHNNKVLTLIMSEFMTRDAINYSVIAMSGIIVIIPPLLASIIFRKNLVSGLTAGSVKE